MNFEGKIIKRNSKICHCWNELLDFFLAVSFKTGAIDDDDLEGLSEKLGNSWEKLARRLKFNEAEITGFHKENEEYAKKPLKMLQKWKAEHDSQATYEVLYHALTHKFVARKDLANEFCTVSLTNQ